MTGMRRQVTDIRLYQDQKGLWRYQGVDEDGRKVTSATPENGFSSRSRAKRAAHTRYQTARIR